MLTFNRKYFYLTIILFAIEIFIAILIKDSFIRPFVGDVLVVILIYCFVRTFLRIDRSVAAISVLVFAIAIEILQYFNFVDRLGLQNNRILAVALGSTFDGKDILAYIVGTAIVWWWDRKL
jgi:hypothetical protein